MAAKRSRSRGGRRFVATVHKSHGVIQPRVQRVGPEHFGIVSVDCAKARFKWMLCDFYGKVLIPPTTVEHNRPELDFALAQLQAARREHELRDLIVAVERTGRYHHIPQRLFAANGDEVRIVHPFTSKQYRQTTDPGNKTDDTDLAAIHRAAASGCALSQAPVEPLYRELQMLIRQRRDWVRKTSKLCCQIREYLHSAYPGYVACFGRPWHSDVMLVLVRHFESALAMQQANRAGLAHVLRQQRVRFQQSTLDTVLAWARQAPPADSAAAPQRRIALALEDDRQRKVLEIQALERDIAGRLVRTPYIVLLSFPGVNVVSAADFAGEMGPIENYLTAKAITGRAGLFPSRYQSDWVDRPNGSLVRCANHLLRAAIMNIADNLIGCNHYFRSMSERWKALGRDPRANHVRVACRFCRIAFQMVAGRQVFHHPGMQHRDFILDKRNAFHREHETDMAQVMADLLAAAARRLRREWLAGGALRESHQFGLDHRVALRDLLVVELVEIVGLPQGEQVFGPPGPFEGLGNRLGIVLALGIAQRGQRPGIALAHQDRRDDPPACHAGDVGHHFGQLDIHLFERLLHVLGVAGSVADLHLSLPMVATQRHDRIGRPE
jgi:transposase